MSGIKEDVSALSLYFLLSDQYEGCDFRQSNICHNLATLAIESVELAYPASIDIAQQVVQASPSAPDEDACVKVSIQSASVTQTSELCFSHTVSDVLFMTYCS